MSDITSPNSISMNISIDEDDDEVIIFTGDWSFEDDYPDEYIDFLQDILAGVYALIFTQMEQVVAAGRIVREAPGFNGFQAERDEALADPEDGVEGCPDDNVIKFNPNKDRLH